MLKDFQTVRHHLQRPFVFGLVGVANTVLDLTLFAALCHVGLHPLLANVVSFVVGSINSFILNDRITFKVRDSSVANSAAFLPFMLIVLVSLLLAELVIWILISMHVSPMSAKLASLLVTFAAGYAGNRFFVFRSRFER